MYTLTGHDGYSFFNLRPRWVGWSTSRPVHFTPGQDPVPIVQEAGWAPEQIWRGAENLAPIGTLSPERPASSESLYRLRQPGPVTVIYTVQGHRERWTGFETAITEKVLDGFTRLAS